MQLRSTSRRRHAARALSGAQRFPGRSLLSLAALTAALALAPVGAANAAPGALYFHSGNTDCVLHDDGSFACGFGQPYNPPRATVTVAGMKVPVPFGVSQVSYGGAAIPTLPSFGSADRYTQPGGNPDIDDVATGQGQWGPVVEYGGTTCSVGFHGSFTCTSGEHGYTTWSGSLAMS